MLNVKRYNVKTGLYNRGASKNLGRMEIKNVTM